MEESQADAARHQEVEDREEKLGRQVDELKLTINRLAGEKAEALKDLERGQPAGGGEEASRGRGGGAGEKSDAPGQPGGRGGRQDEPNKHRKS